MLIALAFGAPPRLWGWRRQMEKSFCLAFIAFLRSAKKIMRWFLSQPQCPFIVKLKALDGTEILIIRNTISEMGPVTLFQLTQLVKQFFCQEVHSRVSVTI